MMTLMSSANTKLVSSHTQHGSDLSNWKEMLGKYGQEFILINATYKTSQYAIPKYMYAICVPLNVGYLSVYSILVSGEKRETIRAALKIVSQWNPEWKPSYVMTDIDERKMTAVSEVFLGLLIFFVVTFIYIRTCTPYCRYPNRCHYKILHQQFH